MKRYNVSITHMWVHVIYLQWEVLSIQQRKPKNCWYTADETTCAVSQLWPFFSEMMITAQSTCPANQPRLTWRAGAPPALTPAAALHPLSQTRGVLGGLPSSTGSAVQPQIHRENTTQPFNPGFIPLKWGIKTIFKNRYLKSLNSKDSFKSNFCDIYNWVAYLKSWLPRLSPSQRLKRSDLRERGREQCLSELVFHSSHRQIHRKTTHKWRQGSLLKCL